MQDRNQEQQQQPANASNEIPEDQEQVSTAIRGLTATYSPEDNKIRIRSVHRLDADTYARVKAAGFSWAPKQQLFVAPMWTPGRADLALELCGEIGDEDTTLVERAEERADRFEDYSEKRAREANTAREAVDAIAEHIPLGQPILIGHHSESRARKDAERIASGMRKAYSCVIAPRTGPSEPRAHCARRSTANSPTCARVESASLKRNSGSSSASLMAAP